MATVETVQKVFKLMSRAYTDYASKNLSGSELAETVRLYQRILADVPDPLLEAACIDHISRSQWWPKPAELRERCMALQFDRSNRLTSAEAWQKAKRAAIDCINKTGDPIIDRIMGALGWKEFGLSDIDDEPSWRARFMSSYEQAMTQQIHKENEHPLVTEARKEIDAGRPNVRKEIEAVRPKRGQIE